MNGNDTSAPYRYGNYRRILFCSDFSENADFAFEFAIGETLRNPDATLYLLHVLPEPDAQFWKTYIYDSDDDPDAKAKADIDAHIARSYLPRLPNEITCQKIFRIGKAAEEILTFSKEEMIDLIVLGRQGKGAIRSIFFGNVAAKVARHATCPLLIIPMAFAQRQL